MQMRDSDVVDKETELKELIREFQEKVRALKPWITQRELDELTNEALSDTHQ
jgi:hypothetical protein